MTHPGSFAVAAAVPGQATFGRDGAMFESLLGFVAQLSLVLWVMVTLTVVIRFFGIWFYRRAARRALARIGAAGTSATATPESAATGAAAAAPAVTAVVLPAIAVVPAIAAGMDLLQPANIPLVDAVAGALATNSMDG